MMGNRGGALHNSDREIVRRYKSRRWIACVLEFRGRYRTVMSPNRYTELFFLDEAVALAAGHRPCAECRRERYNTFKGAWKRAYGQDEFPFADDMDRKLHPERIAHGKKVTYEAALESLPYGCFVEIDGGLSGGRRHAVAVDAGRLYEARGETAGLDRHGAHTAIYGGMLSQRVRAGDP